MKPLTIEDIANSVGTSHSYVVMLNSLARQFVIAEYMIGIQMGTLESNKAINMEQLQAEAVEIDNKLKQYPYLRDSIKSMVGQSTFPNLRIVDPPQTESE